MTSKTPLTGYQVGLPDSCTPMKLKGLWPHVPSLGQTRDQLECRLSWQSPRSIGLCDSSWYLWCCDSSAQTSADAPWYYRRWEKSVSEEVHHISAEMMTSDSKHVPSFRPTEGHKSRPMGFVHLEWWVMEGPWHHACSFPGMALSPQDCP